MELPRRNQILTSVRRLIDVRRQIEPKSREKYPDSDPKMSILKGNAPTWIWSVRASQWRQLLHRARRGPFSRYANSCLERPARRISSRTRVHSVRWPSSHQNNTHTDTHTHGPLGFSNRIWTKKLNKKGCPLATSYERFLIYYLEKQHHQISVCHISEVW